MAERKIRLTLSSTIVNNVGALIDVDFNGENLDVDVEVTAENGSSVLVKEYTVDVEPGTYNLDIAFKNDQGDVGDRNLVIEKIEFSGNGVDYSSLAVTEANSNLKSNSEPYNFAAMGYVRIGNPNFNPDLPATTEITATNSNLKKLLNPEYNENLTRTDNDDADYVMFSDPGNNARYLYEFVIEPVKIFTASTATFQISFS
jgi:hypothetical protein